MRNEVRTAGMVQKTADNSSGGIRNCIRWKCLSFSRCQRCRSQSMRPAPQPTTGPTKKLFTLCPCPDHIKNVLRLVTTCWLEGFNKEPIELKKLVQTCNPSAVTYTTLAWTIKMRGIRISNKPGSSCHSSCNSVLKPEPIHQNRSKNLLRYF